MTLNPNAFVDGVMNGFPLHIEPPSYYAKAGPEIQNTLLSWSATVFKVDTKFSSNLGI